MRDKTKVSDLRRDILIALAIKAILIGALIMGCKYLKANSDEKMSDERYPIFSEVEH